MESNFLLQFSNIRGLACNFHSVEAHLNSERPAILALSETQVVGDDTKYNINGYTLVPLFIPHRGVALYIRSNVAFNTLHDLKSSNPIFHYLWVKLRVENASIFFCFLYRSPQASELETAVAIEELSDTINKILEKNPECEIAVAGDFNVHNKNWLHFSSHNSPEGKQVELFSNLFQLSQLVKSPTRIPDRDNPNEHLLDLFLTSSPEKYNISVSSPIGGSDHCLVKSSFSMDSSLQILV